MTELNTQLVTATAALFDEAENVSVSLAERMMQLGIGSRAEAQPYALAWASKKYGAPIRRGQRGDGFNRETKQGNAAHQAVFRVLSTIFPPSDLKKPSSSNAQKDVVARLFKQYEAMSAAERRRFKAML